MKLVNLHNHCHYDDGEGLPEEHVEMAIKEGLIILGFSCHAPLPFEAFWTMKREDLPEYLEYITGLKSKYKDRIEILLGLEIDYIPGMMSPADHEFATMGLDYSIGAVHHLDRLPSGDLMPVDADFELFKRGIDEIYHGDGRAACERYYFLVKEMIQRGGFDILGHFDLIKKNNGDSIFFKEDSSWYRDLVFGIVDTLSKKDILVEINTGGISRNYTKEVYPSPWILEYMNSKNIKVIISSDSHRPATVAAGYDDLRRLLPRLGYKEYWTITSGGRKRIVV